ncbi:MAG: helix-turn-helix domain-containing protein [Candidatus Uhrbacteria bacterium]
MNPILERELQKLDLSEKEAQVYLAALELGPQPVQDIARKASVNRATTYVMIESLIKRGLMSSHDRGKKRVFAVEPPDKLLSTIRVQEQALREREREFLQVLPQLRAILATSGERPGVRFYESAEGIRAIREEIVATDANELWAAVDCKPGANQLSTPEHDEYDRRISEKGVKQFVLYTGQVAPEEIREHPNWKFRRIDEQRFPLQGEVTVFGNKIFAFTYAGKLVGAVIESAELAATLRSIFKLAWEGVSTTITGRSAVVPPVPPKV